MAGFGSDELQSFQQLGFEIGLKTGTLLILQLGTPVKLNIFLVFLFCAAGNGSHFGKALVRWSQYRAKGAG